MTGGDAAGSAAVTNRLVAGRYRLEHVLGQGGVGTVWRAHDVELDRPVAIKRLRSGLEDDAAAVERFRREATAAAALTHPSLVTVYDVGEDDGRSHLVMELVEGPTLAQLMALEPLSPADVATIGRAVAGALGVAHRQGLVHRDVKPGNVIVSRDGIPKLTDFGIAKAASDSLAPVTMPGTVVGTARYLAPEQLQGGPVDPRSDVYALGLLLHECLTGQPVFGTGTPAEVLNRRLAGEPPAPSSLRPDVPAELDAVVVRATRRAPRDRYPDGMAVARQLASMTPPDAERRLRALARNADPADQPREDATRVLSAPTTVVPRHEPPEPAESGHERAPWPWLAVFVVAVLAVMAVIGLDGRGDGGRSATDDAASPTTVPIAAASDFDPYGGGDEHHAEVPAAYDGDPGTAWSTEHYQQADLGGIKPGVGVWFDLGRTTDVARVQLDLGIAGADLALYAFDGPPPTDRSKWGSPAATVTGSGTQEQLTLREGTRGRVWLVWFTSLGHDGADYRATVQEIAFQTR